MRRVLVVSMSLVVMVGLVVAGWWAYQNRLWLHDDYKDGYQAGALYGRQDYLADCQRRVDERYGAIVSVSMPEDAAAFTIGCYDAAARDRYRPAAVGSLLAEFMGKSDVRFWPSW